MDFSSANIGLWSVLLQFGVIAAMILISNILRRKIPFVRKSLLPTAVLAGFILLILRSVHLFEMNTEFLEMITYHGIAIGFIALSLRIPAKSTKAEKLSGPKSGALIISSYLIQGIMGLIITVLLGFTFMPNLFKAAGILLPMGYGQGPGQANNIGSMYETLGFAGGRSFGLSIAAAGYLSACIVGIIFLNILVKKGKVKIKSYEEVSGSLTVDAFQDKNEIPIAESIDRLSMQFAFVLVVYLLTYLAIDGLAALAIRFGGGMATTLETLLWGFNFIFGSVVAILVRSLFKILRRQKLMTRQYQNNYLLSRISGLAFDYMIVAGIASIEFSDLVDLWLPFILMSIAGAIGTYFFLRYICKHVYPDYFYEGLVSMYGMMTGTISSGVLLLREIDPEFKTPAANNMLTGSSFAILIGAPMLLLIGIAPNSELMTLLTLILMFVYLAPLLYFLLKKKKTAAEDMPDESQ
jgi:ESS family glutamate:Na+ symporter